MKKQIHHLNLYKKWLKEGTMNYLALCFARDFGDIDGKLLALFYPTEEDRIQLIKEGKNTMYWGSDSHSACTTVFTPLRQIILLFIAAMNNEL